MPTASWIWRIALSAYLAGSFGGAALSADLLVAMPNWPSGQAAANIIKYGLKEKLNLDVDVREMGTMMAFAGLDSGDVDIYPEVWLPNFNSLVKKYVDDRKTVRLSPQGVSATQGICVTRETADKYGIKDISDLADPDEGGDLRHRRRWQGRNVDRRAELVVDEHREDPGQELRLCQDDDAPSDARGHGNGRGRCSRRNRATDRVLLLQPAPHVRAPRARPD